MGMEKKNFVVVWIFLVLDMNFFFFFFGSDMEKFWLEFCCWTWKYIFVRHGFWLEQIFGHGKIFVKYGIFFVFLCFYFYFFGSGYFGMSILWTSR